MVEGRQRIGRELGENWEYRQSDSRVLVEFLIYYIKLSTVSGVVVEWQWSGRVKEDLDGG